LDCLVGHIFPFETIVYGPKWDLKWMIYHKNTENPNKIFIVFSGKLAARLLTINYIDGARTGMSGLDHLEEHGLS